jgi:ABC-type antimicrobial peptide transport system permease subunit
VNESFAKRYFAGANPVGRKIRAWGKWLTVVGLVKDAKYHKVAAAAEPYFYAPYRQFFSTGLTTVFYIRTTGSTTAAVATLRREAAKLNPEAEVLEAMPLSDYISSSLYPLKVAATLLTALGVLAILLAATGLYSVMAYAVSQRTRELGIRMALGAQRADVLKMVLSQGLRLTCVGLAIGLVGALAVTRLISAMLVKVTAADPITFGGSALFLLAIALVASYVPAYRATKVDPMTALRWE